MNKKLVVFSSLQNCHDHVISFVQYDSIVQSYLKQLKIQKKYYLSKWHLNKESRKDWKFYTYFQLNYTKICRKEKWHNSLNTVVGDNIIIMKTTFELNFDSYKSFKQHGYTKNVETKRSCQFKSFSLITWNYL